MNNNLFVLTGPSGCGKGTVLNRLLSTHDNIFLSISATTRKPRVGEIEGVNYFFLCTDEFENGIEKNEFIEYAKYAENYYGTPREPVINMLNSGKNVILEIEVEGALQIKEKMPYSVLIFIAAPSFEVLEHRLRSRASESEEDILKRLEIARKEMSMADRFDHFIINDEIDDTIENIARIMDNRGCF